MTDLRVKPRKKRKITVSLPAELVERAEEAVSVGRVPSVSQYVAEAMDARESGETLDELLATMEPSTPESRAWARDVLYGTGDMLTPPGAGA